jgi:hypothetical protein
VVPEVIVISEVCFTELSLSNHQDGAKVSRPA